MASQFVQALIDKVEDFVDVQQVSLILLQHYLNLKRVRKEKGRFKHEMRRDIQF